MLLYHPLQANPNLNLHCYHFHSHYPPILVILKYIVTIVESLSFITVAIPRLKSIGEAKLMWLLSFSFLTLCSNKNTIY